jgi:hypothetical protein
VIGIHAGLGGRQVSSWREPCTSREKVVLWVPPGQGTPETVVYEVEVVAVVKPPAIAKRAPTDKAAAPNAQPH